MLGSGVKHRHSRKKSIEGSFVTKKKGKEDKKKVYRNIHVGLGRQPQETESILAEDNDTPIECLLCGQEPLAENYLEAVLFLVWV